MRILTLGLLVLGGCALYPFEGDDDDVCAQVEIASEPAPTRMINPNTLTCEEFSYVTPCNSDCGPCPGIAQYIPPWGRCESVCSGLGEAACEGATTCRVTREYERYYTGQPSFEGCYEIASVEQGDPLPGCETLGAEACASHSECTGIYAMSPSAPLHAPRGEFRGCIPEGRIAGSCGAPVMCAAPPPSCPVNTTPGVAAGCWTGACIPDELCLASGG